MNVAVSETNRAEIDEPALRDFAASILVAEGVSEGAALAINFVDAADISELNERFMGKQGPTDVLSFPIEDATPGVPPISHVGGPPLHLGDIFICADVVDEHAASHEVAFDNELYLMVTHGVLHILGWDHQTDDETLLMESREAKHLETIGRKRR